jgi:hypothetical protein
MSSSASSAAPFAVAISASNRYNAAKRTMGMGFRSRMRTQ